MTDKPKRGMAALLAEQQRQVAEGAASPASPASDARTARASGPAVRATPARSPAGTTAAARTTSQSRNKAASSASDASPSRPASSARDAGPGKAARLRSWYMTPATADALAEAVDDLHHATRAPKYEVLAVIVQRALADLGPVEAELRARMAAGE